MHNRIHDTKRAEALQALQILESLVHKGSDQLDINNKEAVGYLSFGYKEALRNHLFKSLSVIQGRAAGQANDCRLQRCIGRPAPWLKDTLHCR